MNCVMLTGPIAKTAELKKLPNTDIATFIVKDEQGYKQNKKDHYFKVLMFGKFASAVGPYLKAGKIVSLRGTLQQEKWVDGSGNQKTGVSILCEKLDFVSTSAPARAEQTTAPPVEDGLTQETPDDIWGNFNG